MNIINLAYFLVILIYLAIGAAIVFHMLHYKINRHAAMLMFIIYSLGSILLLISNFSFFKMVDWYQIFSSFTF